MSIKKTATKVTAKKTLKNKGLNQQDLLLQSALGAEVNVTAGKQAELILKDNAKKTTAIKKRKIGEDEEALQNDTGEAHSGAAQSSATASASAEHSAESGQPMVLAQADSTTKTDVSSGVKGSDTATETTATAAEAGAGLSTAQMIGLGALGVLGVGGVTAIAVSSGGGSSGNNNNGSGNAPTTNVTSADTVAPTAPQITSAGGLLSSVRPTITGTAEANSTVKIYDGSNLLGTATADNSGNFSFTPSADLAQGAHSITATATDAASNVSGSAAAVVFTVDTIAPVYQSMAVHSNSTTTNVPTIELTYDSAIDAINAPSFGNFVISINSAPNPVTQVSVNGQVVTLTLTNPLTPGALTIGFNYTDAAGNTANAIQDAAGNDAASLGITTGIVADGYIRGAQMYLDAPSGLQILAGVVTDENGNFFLTTGSNPNNYALVAVGGVNIDTGLPNTSNLKAPAGATTINPLTTLVAAVMGSATYASVADAEAAASAAATKVASALGLSLTGSNSLLNYDPIKNNDTTIQKAAAQVATIVALAESGATGSNAGSAEAAVVSNIASAIVNASTASAGSTVVTISLADSTVLSQALTGVILSAAAQSTIADAATAISTASSVAAISAAQSQFLDTIAPDAPTSLAVAAITNDTTPTVRVNLNVTSLDGKAAVVGDKVILMDDGVEVGATVVGGLTQADIAQGYVNVTASTLNAGSHSFTAKLVDQSGNAGLASAAVVSQIDTQGPSVILKSSADSVQTGQTVTLSIIFSEAVESFAKEDIKAVSGNNLITPVGFLGALSAPVTQSDGSVKYTISYTAPTGSGSVETLKIDASSYADRATNAGAVSNALDLTAVNPPVVVIKSIGGTDGIVSGISGDNIVTGIGEPNLLVTVKSGTTTLGAVMAAPDGTWSYTLTTPAQGAASITAVQSKTVASTDYVGTSAPFTIDVDTAAPNAPSFTTVAGHAANTVNPVGINASDKATTGGATITGSAEAGAKVALTLASGIVKQLTTDGSGHWTYTLTDADYKAIGQGTQRTLSVVATDAAGNSTTPVTQVITVDTVAPTLTQVNVTTTGLSALGMSNDSTPTISGVAEVGSNITITDQTTNATTTLLTTTIGSGGTYSFTPTSPLAEGVHNFTVTATDTVGNTSTRTTKITIDSTAPASPGLVLGTGVVSGATATEATQSTGVITVNAELGSTVAVTFTNGLNTVTKTVIGSGSAKAVTLAAADLQTLGNGTISVSAKATDAAGNASAVGSASFVLDSVGPVVSSIVMADTALKAGDTSLVTITFSEAVEGLEAADLTHPNGALTNPASTDGGITWTATYTPAADIEDTTNVITLNKTGVADLAGNAGVGTSSTANYDIDTKAPAVIPDSPVDGGNTLGLVANLVLAANETIVKGTGSITLYNAATNQVIETFDVTGNRVAITGTGAATKISIDPTSDLVKDQTYYVKATSGALTDSAGNPWGGINDATTWNFTGAGVNVTINTVATDDYINATEKGSVITVTGTVAGEAAILDAYSASALTVTLGGTTLSNVTYTHTQGQTTGSWTAQIAANAFSGTVDQALVATFTGATNTAAAGVVGQATKTVHFDDVSPSLVMTSNKSVLKAGETATINFSFSEDPGNTFTWDGSSGDVTVSGGTLGAISGLGLTRTAIFTPSTNANSGTASITVASGSYADTAGNTGSAGTTPSITFDTLAPSAPTLAISTVDADHLVSGTHYVNTASPSVSVTGIESNASWQYQLDSTSGSWQAGSVNSIALSGLSQGMHTLYAHQTDAAGNLGSNGSLSFTIDTVGPTAAALALHSDTGTAANDYVTNNGVIDVTLASDVTSWQYSVDNGLNWSVGSGTSFLVPSSATQYATGVIQVKSFDAAGNSTVGIFAHALTVDVTGPTAAQLSTSTTSLTGLVTVTPSSDADHDHWAYSINSGSTWTLGAGTSFLVDTTTAYTSGQIQVKDFDVAGNSSTTLADAVSLAATKTITFATAGTTPSPTMIPLDGSGNASVTADTNAHDVFVIDLALNGIFNIDGFKLGDVLKLTHLTDIPSFNWLGQGTGELDITIGNNQVNMTSIAVDISNVTTDVNFKLVFGQNSLVIG